MDYAIISDAELTDLLRTGDRAAFTEIYNRHWDWLFFHGLKMLKSADQTEDAVQELFVSLWTNAGAIRYNSNLKGYLYTLLRNRILNLIEKEQVKNNYLDSLGHFADTFSHSPLERLDEKDLLEQIEREIQQLPEKMRRIFELSRKEHLSHKEIAEQLNISDKTVKKQIGNAIKIIRLRLSGFTLLAFIYASLNQ